jgi:hypothetical protein
VERPVRTLSLQGFVQLGCPFSPSGPIHWQIIGGCGVTLGSGLMRISWPPWQR